MTELLPFLKDLLSAPGLTGQEGPVRRRIAEAWKPLTDELSVSKLGSLHGLLKANRTEGSSPDGKRPSILYAAHMDAIGLMVKGVVDGFLRVTQVGGLDPRVLPGQLVTVYGREELPGVIVQPPAHLLPETVGEGPLPIEYLLVDVGRDANEVHELVRVGDLVAFAQSPIELGADYLAGHSLDNRVSVAAVTICLQELQARQRYWDVWAAATTQEEETLGGAFTSAFQIRPSLAVAIDVTFASSPGSPGHLTFPLGKGVTLAWGPNIHPALYKSFKEIAERMEIPFKLEPAPRNTGTDAIALQVTAEGIPSMVVGIPLRYMHTPVEMVSIKDVRRAGRLLAEFAASLQPDYLDSITWED
jgi:endoglucanase